MLKSFIKPSSLIASLVLGFLLSEYAFHLAKYSAPCLFLMLFLSMVKIDKFFESHHIKPILIVIFAPLIFGGIFYAFLSLFLPINSIILTSSALIILSPLATTAVVMVKAIKGNMPFTVMVIILSHFVTIIFWPAFSFFSEMDIAFLEITLKLGMMVLLPFFASRIIRKTPAVSYVSRFENLGFYLWVFVVFANISSISHMFKSGLLQTHQLLLMLTISFSIFMLNYITGTMFSRKSKFQKETLQLFIQRNTVFGIWLANTFFNPLYAICPIFYLIFQNVYNTGRLIVHNQYETKEKTK